MMKTTQNNYYFTWIVYFFKCSVENIHINKDEHFHIILR